MGFMDDFAGGSERAVPPRRKPAQEQRSRPQETELRRPPDGIVSALQPPYHRLVCATKQQIWVTGYDQVYADTAEDGTPIDATRRPRFGACADVVVRAYASCGVLLVDLLYKDIKANPPKGKTLWGDRYPNYWGEGRANKTIDHRRVINLHTFHVRRNLRKQPGSTYESGDILTGMIRGQNGNRSQPHIVIVAYNPRRTDDELTIVHNSGFGVRWQPLSWFTWEEKGHFRPFML